MITYRLMFRPAGTTGWMTEHLRIASRLEAYEAYADAVRQYPHYEWRLASRNTTLTTMLQHQPQDSTDD